ncbi:MAG: metallophosphatase family protein [Candidatus Omnitrophica bacterium]|nr:metallophosphatase family protein [Candidatus Omnitrophota bacterium]
MRYGIFSDIHSNLEALEAILKASQTQGIDEYLCIGDIVGYAADPAECLKIVRSTAAIIVAGNHDWVVADRYSIEYFNPYAAAAVKLTAKLLTATEKEFLASLKLVFSNEHLTLVHGTLDRPEVFNYLFGIIEAKDSFLHLATPLLFVGHTHVPAVYSRRKDGVEKVFNAERVVIEPGSSYIVNIGSVGQPRDSNPQAAYCIYDTAENEICIKRVSYDIEKARQKIIAAGLPVLLGDRLLVGK